MIRTTIFPCSLPKPEADALNQESARIYTRTLVEHYRVYRHTGRWLSVNADCKIEDRLGGPTSLHAHSRDAAQQAFYKACKTARANRDNGAHYPHKRKFWRTTIWKNTGLHLKPGGVLHLARARGLEPVVVSLPSPLADLPQDAFHEARLVWDKASRHYDWHLVIEDGVLPPEEPPGKGVGALDLGEIHPVTFTDGQAVIVITARALRSVNQYTHKRLAELQRQQAAKQKGSRAWKRLQRRKNRFLAQQARRKRDIEHKVSHETVTCSVEHGVGTLAMGDVRDVADGKRLHTQSQQKVSNWSHGRQRQYTTYKAKAHGIGVELEDEAYSSQACPNCGERHKPKGRVFRCPFCGFVSHRDGVGACNILSHRLYSEIGHIKPPSIVKYRQPFGRANRKEIEWCFTLSEAKRSRLDTAELAVAERVARHARQSTEAALLSPL